MSDAIERGRKADADAVKIAEGRIQTASVTASAGRYITPAEAAAMRDDETIRELYEVRKELLRQVEAREIGWGTAFESLYIDAARKLRNEKARPSGA
jgi:hypothetical protein